MFKVISQPGDEDIAGFYAFRKKIYRQDHQVEFDLKDEWDDRATFFLVKEGRTIVGGVRLLVSSPEKPLPVEEEMPFLASLFPLAPVGRYLEMSRFSVHEEFRQGEVSLLLFCAIETFCLEQGARQLVFMTNDRISRRYSIGLKRLNRLHGNFHLLEEWRPSCLEELTIGKHRGFIRAC